MRRRLNTVVSTRRSQKIVKHSNGRCDGEDDEEPASQRPAVLQLAKSNAAILGIKKIQYSANQS